MLDREQEQARVEELFAETSRAYEERRRRQRILECISYHRRQIQGHEITLGGLVAYHLREQECYQSLLAEETEEA